MASTNPLGNKRSKTRLFAPFKKLFRFKKPSLRASVRSSSNGPEIRRSAENTVTIYRSDSSTITSAALVNTVLKNVRDEDPPTSTHSNPQQDHDPVVIPLSAGVVTTSTQEVEPSLVLSPYAAHGSEASISATAPVNTVSEGAPNEVSGISTHPDPQQDPVGVVTTATHEVDQSLVTSPYAAYGLEAPISVGTPVNTVSENVPVEDSGTSSDTDSKQDPVGVVVPSEPATVLPIPTQQLDKSLVSSRQGKSKALENVELTGRFLKTVVTTVGNIVDTDPVKIAFNIMKAVLDAKDVIDENAEGIARRLVITAQQLNVVVEAMRDDDWRPTVLEAQRLEQFEKSMKHQLQAMKDLAAESKFRKILDHEDERKRIAEIFENINEARILFELGIISKTFRTVEKISNDLSISLLKDLEPSRVANHQYYLEGEERETMPRATCTPGTRVRIMKEIVAWANNTSGDCPKVYWLFGPSGYGKTTIAYSIARRFETVLDPEDMVILGADFFCSRQTQETRESKRIVRTLAYQLALKCEPFSRALKRFEAVDRSVATQFEELLIKPWKDSETERRGGSDCDPLKSFLVVIDALDEVEGEGGYIFLKSLFDIIKNHRLPGLKFFVTSRPNPKLVSRVESFRQGTLYRLQDVDAEEASGDITTYLEEYLPDFRGDELMIKIVRLASGLFIYAATVVKRLLHCDLFEKTLFLEELASTSKLTSSDTSSETLPLDTLYRQILSDAFKNLPLGERTRRLRFLHTVLCAFEPISPETTANLHPKEHPTLPASGVVNKLVECLYAVLYLSGNQIFWFHKSFQDFMFDQQCSGEFWCNTEACHSKLTNCCFRVMKEGLRFNIAEIESSFLLDDENEMLAQRVEKNIQPTLSYSCRHWGNHFVSCTQVDVAAFIEPMTEFIQCRGLFWIEAMNLLKSSGSCSPLLHTVLRWLSTLTSEGAYSTLKKLLAEFASFALYFSGSPAALSTPHLYISSLATWPRTADPCQRWRKNFPCIPKFTNSSRVSAFLMSISVERENPSTGVSLTEDGMQIVSAYKDTVKMWDGTTGKELGAFRAHGIKIGTVAISSDGKLIAAGSDDGLVKVWDSTSGNELDFVLQHQSYVLSIQFSRDGKFIVSGSHDKTVKMWNSTSGNELFVFTGHDAGISSVALSRDGKWIVSGSHDNTARLLDTATGKEVKIYRGHTDSAFSVGISNDGKWIVSGSYDRTIRVWDRITAEQLKVFKSAVLTVAFSSNGNWIVSGSHYGMVRVWDREMGKELMVLKGHEGMVRSVAFSNDGNSIVSASDDGSIRVWDNTVNEEKPIDVSAHQGAIKAVTFSRDGKWIVSASSDMTVRLWDSKTGEQLKVLEGHTGSAESVAISDDGKYIVSGSWDRIARIWHSMSGEELQVLKGHESWITSVAFSYDGRLVVTGSYDNTVRLWDTKTGKELLRMTDGAFVAAVSFCGDGKRIVSVSHQAFTVWCADTGERLAMLEHAQGSPGAAGSASQDGRWVSLGSYGTTILWDSTTGEQVKYAHAQRVTFEKLQFLAMQNGLLEDGATTM